MDNDEQSRGAALETGDFASAFETTQVSKTLQVQSILYHNHPGELKRSLASVVRAVEVGRNAGLFDRVVIVWGDCSPTPTFPASGVDQLSKVALGRGIDALEYVHFNANLGSAAGHNNLLSGSHFDHVVIVNPGTLMAPDCLIELMRSMRSNLHGISEARQIPIEHPKTYDEKTGETSWASTACALISGRVLADIGGFDCTNFFLYCDDVDFSWRARLAGYSVVFQPAARIFHDKRVNQRAQMPASAAEVYYSAEAALMLAHKYSRPDLVKSIVRDLIRNGNETQRKAVAEFEKRDLPDPIDPDHIVGEFTKGNYAKHRF